jgi:hypothetical protein
MLKRSILTISGLNCGHPNWNPGDARLHAIRDDHATEYVVTYSKNRTSGYIFLFEKEFTTISPWGSEFENLSGGSYDKKGRGRK